MKLKTKTTLVIMLPVFLAFILVLGYSSYTMYKEQKTIAAEMAENMSKEFANEIKTVLEIAMAPARTVSDMVPGMIESGEISREMFDVNLRNILENNQQIYGIWAVFEENAFDGRDNEYKNTLGHDSSGKYIPYWYREDGKINRSYLENYDVEGLGDFYLLAFNTGKETVMEPFEYTIDGKTIMFTSLTVPVKLGGKTIGAIGVDMTLDSLQEITNDLKIYKTGFGRLMTNTGLVVTHPDSERIGKLAGEFGQNNSNEIIERLDKGESFSQVAYSKSEDKNMFKSFAPFTIGRGDGYWTFGTVISENEIYENVYELIRTQLFIIAISLVMLGIIIYFISKGIVNPITVVTEAVNKQADLDFSYNSNLKDIEYINRKDEIGIMMRSLKLMEENIRSFISKTIETSKKVADYSEELTTTAQQVSSASEEVAKTIDEIAKGATDQAKNTSEGSEELIELGMLIENNKKNIDNLLNSSNNVDILVNEGLKVIDTLTIKTLDSSKASNSVYESIKKTNESSVKISEASNLIASVSEQTNLLALNAAIEAARAGEHGRGFAVVAEEIRKLAEQSTESTKIIDEMVKALQLDSKNAVSIMEEVGKIIKDQVDNVNLAEDKYKEIAEAIKASKEAVEIIDDLSSMMEDKKNHVLDNMQTLSAVAEENAAGTEEASAATEEQLATIEEIANSSEELANLSLELEHMIEKFKL